jgi:hypothetical protein
MTKHFITGTAQSVTNSVERLTALRTAHPEWNEALTPKAAARVRLAKSASKSCGCESYIGPLAALIHERSAILGG